MRVQLVTTQATGDDPFGAFCHFSRDGTYCRFAFTELTQEEPGTLSSIDSSQILKIQIQILKDLNVPELSWHRLWVDDVRFY